MRSWLNWSNPPKEDPLEAESVFDVDKIEQTDTRQLLVFSIDLSLRTIRLLKAKGVVTDGEVESVFRGCINLFDAVSKERPEVSSDFIYTYYYQVFKNRIN